MALDLMTRAMCPYNYPSTRFCVTPRPPFLYLNISLLAQDYR